jgi:hypothetical protein
MAGTLLLVMADIHLRGHAWVRYSHMRALSRNRLQKRAPHRTQLIFVRQIARKPQPPIARRIVDFS